jgi:hypothetical protein
VFEPGDLARFLMGSLVPQLSCSSHSSDFQEDSAAG